MLMQDSKAQIKQATQKREEQLEIKVKNFTFFVSVFFFPLSHLSEVLLAWISLQMAHTPGVIRSKN